jgi:hypothetical protein
MRILQLVAVAAVSFYGYQKWHSHKTSSREFMPVAMPDDAIPNQVIIFAPLQCPSEATIRANALAAKLNQLGISVRRSDSFKYSYNNRSDLAQASLVRSGDLMNGELPAVFINGRGKAQPSLEEIVAELNSIRQ